MKNALGLIETKGLVAAIAAADKALKSARVNLEGKEITEPGYVTIKLTGELNEVQIAVSAGTEAARNTGELVSSIVISQPDDQLLVLLPDLHLKSKYDERRTEIHYITEPSEKILIPEEKEPGEIIPLNLASEESTVKNAPAQKKGKRVKRVAKKAAAPEIKKASDHIRSKLIDSANDTISRLRREALGKNVSSAKPVIKNEIKNDNSGEDLNSLNVHQLRKLARNTPDFPIFGRKVSKANRDELLKLFNGLGQT